LSKKNKEQMVKNNGEGVLFGLDFGPGLVCKIFQPDE
jgi:hypothetical protein